MKRSVLFVALVCWLPLTAPAQAEYPRAEVFGGYSYFRADDSLSFTGLNLHGWNAAFAGNVSGWFGIAGDVSGHYGSPDVFGVNVPFLDVHAHSFLVGPAFSYRSETVTPFAHFLIGTTRASAGVLGLTYAKNALSAAVGGGVDIRISDRVAVRAIQADYLMTRFYDERQNNLRLSAGIVFRFGTR